MSSVGRAVTKYFLAGSTSAQPLLTRHGCDYTGPDRMNTAGSVVNQGTPEWYTYNVALKEGWERHNRIGPGDVRNELLCIGDCCE
jgi:hypothetical protein